MAAVALGSAGPAQAGLVTGSWDPAFGEARLGLNWAIQGEFFVPNACSAQADGNYSTSSGACAGASTISLNLRLYNNLADANNFNESSPNSQVHTLHADAILYGNNGGYLISEVRVLAGQIVGFLAGFAGTADSPIYETFNAPGEGQSSAYGAWLNLLGPSIVCYQCGDDEANVLGDNAGLSQFLVTYNSEDDSDAKFKDANGVPLGALLDEHGGYIGRSTSANVEVPEPGALALTLMALGAAGATSGRRKR